MTHFYNDTFLDDTFSKYNPLNKNMKSYIGQKLLGHQMQVRVAQRWHKNLHQLLGEQPT